MAITYTIDETFTGKRTTEVPDPDNEGQVKSVESSGVKDIQVTFKSDDPAIEQTRLVNVCFDSEGNYDNTATVARIEQVKMGFERKVAVNAIG